MSSSFNQKTKAATERQITESNQAPNIAMRLGRLMVAA